MENKYEQILKDEWEKFKKSNELMHPNILLLGMTGCGKSSLINHVFGTNLAPVNAVKRGTDAFHTYWGRNHNTGVNLIDSYGYELEDEKNGSFSSYYASIKNKIEENAKNEPLKKVHIVWYCISIAGEKIQEYDIKILKLLRNDLNLNEQMAVILTKCDEDDEDGSCARSFKATIEDKLTGDIPIFEVTINPNVPCDFEKMMSWSASQLDDDDLREAFISSQILSIDAKRKDAKKIIAKNAAFASGIAIIPIPFSQAPLLTGLQLYMSARIIRTYGIEKLANVNRAVIGGVLIPNLGKTAARELAKLFPGIGALVGVVNAGVASSITTAIGFAISEICYDCCNRLVRGEDVDFDEIFDLEILQDYFNKFMDTKKKRS